MQKTSFPETVTSCVDGFITLKTRVPSVLQAVVHTVPTPGKHVIHVDQGEHGEGADERAGLDGDATPEQGGMAQLVEQRPDRRLHIGEDAGEQNPGRDLRGNKRVQVLGE